MQILWGWIRVSVIVGLTIVCVKTRTSDLLVDAREPGIPWTLLHLGVHKNGVPGICYPEPTYARDGCMPGTGEIHTSDIPPPSRG